MMAATEEKQTLRECRDAFKAWALDRGCMVESLHGTFLDSNTETLWQGWRAAWDYVES